MKTALIAGATGLVGKNLLAFLLKDPYYDKIKVIGRKPVSGIVDARVQNIVVDFDKLSDYAPELKADDVYCCLGTTMKKAGSKEAFFKVDFQYPLKLAELSLDLGARQFLLVSALGADEKSAIYYNRVKGEIENAIGKIGFASYHIFRPSLLLGHRDEHRSGEEAAKTFYRIFNFLIPQKYKGVDGSKVALAMFHFAKRDQPGRHVHESASLQSF